MRFKTGFLGVLVVVVALMGTILFGYVADVGERTVTVDKFESITDVSGLYEYSQERQYTTYNPAANYTGWAEGDYYFTSSTTANNYAVVEAPGSTTSQTVAVSGLPVASGTLTGPLYNGSSVTVAALLASAGVDYHVTDSCRIDLTSHSDWAIWNDIYGPAGRYLKKPLAIASSWGAYPGASSYLEIKLSDGSTTTADRITGYSEGDVRPYAIPNLTNYRDIASVASWAIVAADGTATVYAETLDLWGNSTTAAVSSGNVGALRLVTSTIAAWGADLPGQPANDGGYLAAWASTWAPATVTITTTTNTTYSYMDIREGITLKNDTISWSNGYQNGQVDLIVKPNGAGTSTIYPTWSDSQRTQGVIISTDSAGNITVTANNDPVAVGKWAAVLLSIHSDGIVDVSPIKSITNMQTYRLSGSVARAGQLAAPTSSDLVGFDIVRSGPSATFSLASTRVFLDTFGAVMVNPSIDIRAYFPSETYPTLRLNMYSFAVIGDSLTINGTTYAVVDGAALLPDGDGYTRVSLNQLYITFSVDGHTYAKIGQADTIDLGPTTDTRVSLGGVWYFTTGADRGYTATETAYDWNVGIFGIDKTQFVVIYAAAVLVGALIARRFANPKILDYVVIGVSLFAILGMI